jgi:hypothetical protein
MKARIRPTTDTTLPAFDHTKLSAINQCPRWGLIRYDQHKRMPGNSRSTALEMGTLAHKCFAAVRLFELLEYGPSVYGESYDRASIDSFGTRMLGRDGYAEVLRLLNNGEDQRQRVYAIAVYVANTSGWDDDPLDRRRTLTNLEHSLAAYIDRGQIGTSIPIISPFIGIEVPVDITVEFWDDLLPLDIVRFIGKVDGLVHPHNDLSKIRVEENKTASRLDQSWQDSFILSHQVTGYCVAASYLTQRRVDEALVRGMMIPLPKTYDQGGIVNMHVERDSWRVTEWLKWFYDTVQVWKKWKDDPLNAPEYTHSCNRYFRSCPFIPLCAMAAPEERKLSLEQMVYDRWNPLTEEHTNE